MAGRPLTAADLWAMPRVGSPAPAPDGSFVVVPVTSYDVESDKGTTRLWRAPAGEGELRALTSAACSSTDPAVSPDGRMVSFVRKPGDGDRDAGGNDAPGAPKHSDKPQLYVMPLDGGEAERLTDMPLGAGVPVWFPDSRRIAFLAPVYRDAPDLGATAERAKEIKESKVTARVTEDRVYRFWDRWLTDGDVHHVFVIDTVTRDVLDLTPTSGHWMPFMGQSGHLAVAPDGGEIAFTAVQSDPPYDPLLYGVFTAPVPSDIGPDAEAGDLRHLTAYHPADAFRPLYAPDGRFIVYGLQREIDYYADRQRIVVYDREADLHTVLTEDWDFLWASEWAFGEDPRRLFFNAEVDARNAVFAIDIDDALEDPTGNPPREVFRGGWLGAPQIAGGKVFATLQSLLSPPEVVSFNLDGTCLEKVTELTAPSLEAIELGPVEEIYFEGAGGDEVQMFVIHPPGSAESLAAKAEGGAQAGAGTPLVHMVHGGPHGVFGDQWHWRWNAQAFAAPGYVVALVNFHGSTGWGEDFASSILGRWGDQPYDDVMAATDLLIERGIADPTRMAVTGGSYGGYLVSWIASQTDRFKCIVNHAGVSDFQPQYASDVTQGRRRSMGGEPWDNVEGLDRYNPARYASGFASPMLVIHGEKDYRVPYVQGLEIYNVYKAMGLPARLVCYPDENHWILKPQNSLHWYGEVLGWLERWLTGSTGTEG
ncbi:MAG: prolyl oligopeptidase family serine peptidase [Anaerolineae bacterium]